MSDELVKEKRTRRLHKEQIKVKKQVKIAKLYGQVIEQSHRFAKKHAMDCGNPKCFLCGNPRKIWRKVTHQEKSSNQNYHEYEY